MSPNNKKKLDGIRTKLDKLDNKNLIDGTYIVQRNSEGKLELEKEKKTLN